MSSAAKQAANRANAILSTGPTDTSRTKFNGVAHGLTSKQTVIPGENQQEYDAFQAELLEDLNPSSPLETLLAERVIAAAWRLKRFTRVETAFFTTRIEAQQIENPSVDPDAALANLFIDPAEIARMRLFLRYQTSVQKEYDTAMREFRKAQAESAEVSQASTIDDIIRAIDAPMANVPQIVVGFASQTASPTTSYPARPTLKAPTAA